MTTVSFGTRVVATAVTIFAPCLAMPPASASRPTMKPEMFCRKSSGMPRWSQSSMKCAPFMADSLNSTPLFATMPIGVPVEVREPGDERVAVLGLELGELAAVDEPGDDLVHVVRLLHVDRDDRRERRRVDRRRARLAHRPGPLGRRGQRRHHVAHELEGVLVVVGEVVGDARHPRVQVAAAELLGGDDLADRRLHERRAAEEDGALVAHDHASRRSSPARTRRRPCTSRAPRRAAGCASTTAAPGCRRSARSARGRGTPRPASAGTRRPSRRGRRTAAGAPSRPPGRGGASSRSSGSTCRP